MSNQRLYYYHKLPISEKQGFKVVSRAENKVKDLKEKAVASLGDNKSELIHNIQCIKNGEMERAERSKRDGDKGIESSTVKIHRTKGSILKE